MAKLVEKNDKSKSPKGDALSLSKGDLGEQGVVVGGVVEGIFKTITTKDGLPDNTITQVVQSEDGTIYAGTNFGICEIILVSDGNYKVGSIFNSATGYPVKDVNAGHNAMFLDSKGIIWAATGSDKTALVRIDCNSILKSDKPPVVILQNLKVNNENICWYNLANAAPLSPKGEEQRTVKSPSGDLGVNADSLAILNEENITFGKTLDDALRDTMQYKFGNIKFDGITKFYPLPQNLQLPYKHNNITIEFAAIEQARPYLVKYQRDEITAQRDLVTHQKEEIEAQRDLVTQQKEHIEEIYHEISDSINYAKRIQQAVLPTGDYADSILGNHFILFNPKDVVSGDFYWATKINEFLIVTVADCTGHGVPGAFMSMLGISFLNEIVRKKEVTQASQVLDQLRNSVIDALKQKGEYGEQKDGMDITLIVLNTETLECQFAGANNPIYVIARAKPEAISYSESDCFVPFDKLSATPRNDEYQLTEIKPDKMPVAIYENMKPFTNHVIQLQKDDIIYLASDGYEDQFGGPKHKKFLSKNLKNLLIANCQQSMADQKELLEKALNDWKGDGEQIDDITVMGIRI